MKQAIFAVLGLFVAVLLIAPTPSNAAIDPMTGRPLGAESGSSGSWGWSPIRRRVVNFDSNQRPGTIIIDNSDRRLYLVMEGGKAMSYGVGVGRPGFSWTGTKRITRKAEWPGWTPPPAMRRRVPGLPAYMPGGPANPLGARALYLGSSLYRIHGSNEPGTIGRAVSSGCIRMTNRDVTDLYARVRVGTKVIVRP